MTTATSVTTYFFIQIPTGDAEMPFTTMGSAFITREQAANALKGWRQELQQVAQINPVSYS